VLATQPATQAVGGVQRETPLTLQSALHGPADLTRRQGLEETAGEARVLRGAHHFVARMGEQMQAGVLESVEEKSL